MPRQKKTSKTLESAATRLASLKSIDPDLDLGNGITVKEFEKTILRTTMTLEKYNTSLSVADQNEQLFEADEKLLKDFNERVLLGVGTRYGKDSNEYEMAGGVKKSNRKKPVRKTPPSS